MLLAALSALPPLAVMLSMAIQWRRHEVLDAQASALDLVRRASSTHERQLQACERTLVALASFLSPQPLQSHDLAAVLDAVSSGHLIEENLAFYTADGQLLASARPVVQANIAARPFFGRAVGTGHLAIDDYAIDLDRRSAILAVARPVRDALGRTERVILRVFDVGWLREVAEGMSLPRGTVLAIFDNRGTIVARHPRAHLPETSRGHSPLVDAALSRNREGTLESDAFDGVHRTFAFAPLRDADAGRKLYLAVGIPTAVATALADRTLLVDFFGFSIAIALLMAVASVAGERLVVRHVRDLVKVAHSFGRGDMSARAQTAGRPAELVDLAATFNGMAEALEARQREVARQRDAAALQEARTRAILENSNEGVSLRDPGGRWLYVSPATARILGCTPDALLGRHATDFVHPDDRKHAHGVLAELLRRPGCVVSTCLRMRHKDGGWRWVACDLQNLLNEPAVAAILTTYRDITDYRHAQEELRRMRDELDLRVRERTAALVKTNQALQAEITERKRAHETLQKLSQVIEQTADSVLVTNRDGVIEYVNPAFETMCGYSRAEAVGKTPRLFSSGCHDARFFETLWSTILSGQVFRTIVTNRTKDGTLFDEDQTITPMRDGSGTVTHFISTGRDITQRKRAEQAVRRLNRQLEQETTRIANLLHDEAGQFLTSAHIMLSDLGRELPAGSRDRLQMVRRHLDQVEESLRTISHDLHPRILTDMGLIGSLRFRAELFTRRTGVKALVVAAEPCELPQAAQVALYRLVQEGLTNIAKHARATAVTIAVSATPQQFVCTIQDDGCGFDADEALDRRDKLTLGMQNMRDRIESLGGTLEVVSRPGHGTVLRATFSKEEWYGCSDCACR